MWVNVDVRRILKPFIHLVKNIIKPDLFVPNDNLDELKLHTFIINIPYSSEIICQIIVYFIRIYFWMYINRLAN